MDENYYQYLAYDYDLKRKKPWNALKIYIDKIQKEPIQFSGLNLDLGCANGRNFRIFLRDNSSKLIGIDKSLIFLKLAKKRIIENNEFNSNEKKRISLILSDISYLPLRNNIANNIFSIATIHHINKSQNRLQILREFYHILTNKGKILITLWRRYQKGYRKYFIIDKSKRIFSYKFRRDQRKKNLKEFGDKLVPWTLSNNNKTYYRFYHFYSRKEVRNLFKDYKIIDFSKYGGPNRKDNFFILVQKKTVQDYS